MPPIGIERKTVRQIATEFERIATALRTYPAGEGGSRTAAPANAILSSLKNINATLAQGARRGSLGSAGFTTLGRSFEKIGATLQAVGSASKTTAKATKKPTSR